MKRELKQQLVLREVARLRQMEPLEGISWGYVEKAVRLVVDIFFETSPLEVQKDLKVLSHKFDACLPTLTIHTCLFLLQVRDCAMSKGLPPPPIH